LMASATKVDGMRIIIIFRNFGGTWVFGWNSWYMKARKPSKEMCSPRYVTLESAREDYGVKVPS
jgi:hypothetical protein